MRAVSISSGYVGAITSRGFLFLANYLPVRSAIYPHLSLFLDLGGGVLDSAYVEVCAYVLNAAKSTQPIHCLDARNAASLETSDDEEANVFADVASYSFSLDYLEEIPSKPFCYDAPPRLLRSGSWRSNIESATKGVARVGLATGDNSRFVRCYWEVPSTELDSRWRWYSKGGEYLPFKPDVHLAVDWKKSGEGIEASFEGARIHKHDVYFFPGVTYSLRSVKGLSFRALPQGCICSNKGPVIISAGNEYSILAVANSSPYKYLVKMQAGFSAFEIGIIQRTPVPTTFPEISTTLSDFGCQLVSHFLTLAYLDETDPYFQWPPFWRRGDSIRNMAIAAQTELDSRKNSARDLLVSVDDLVLENYAWPPSSRPGPEYEKMLDCLSFPTEPGLHVSRQLISTIVGASYGVFPRNIHQTSIVEIDPFGALGQGDPLCIREVPHLERSPILVDDDGHPEDIVARVRDALAVIWGDRSSAIEQEACEILGVRTLRDYFAASKHFFGNHIKRYSKSRRKAPIYWMLAPLSAEYSVWLYYHRFNKDTFYRILKDFVEPKMKHEERKLNNLRQEHGPNPTASQRKEIDAQETFVAELSTFRDEVVRIAPMWNPDLNDGVIINFAPLWRLVPHHKTWQKQCKACWDKLVKGDYDWAHLAMHLWPERVVPKCAKDRSLAIAHGLDEEFWEEGEKGKARAKDVSEEAVEVLIQERTSPGVKAALNDLLNAPAPAGGAKRKRGGSRRKRVTKSDDLPLGV